LVPVKDACFVRYREAPGVRSGDAKRAVREPACLHRAKTVLIEDNASGRNHSRRRVSTE
jgi:hypothetical protein